MTELEYVTSIFPERFSAFRGKRIVLHGSRNYAQEIIRQFNGEFRFSGVMSRDNIEGLDFYGLPVLRESGIPDLKPDMIILTERVKYAEAIYLDIHEICESNGILLFNMYGIDEIEAHRELEKCHPMNFGEWKELCENYQIVAFEAMDVLLIGTDLAVRTQFRKLIDWLISQKTDVRVSLRKSFPAEQQIAALKASGLFPDPEAHVITRQGEDLSFRALREANPGQKILYIGNGLVNECLLPRCYGIDTYRFTDYYGDFGMPFLYDNPIHIPFDSEAKDRLLRRINSSTVVSFDIFDTLLVRKTLRPDDVFELTERQAKKLGYSVGSFAAFRRETERAGYYSTIYDIYDRVRRHFDWSEELTQTMLRLELEIENEVIIPRTEVVELLDYAVAEGKTVVLISDMYLPEQLMRELLRSKGISSFDRLFVSCDYHRSKRDGLFEELSRLAPNPETIIHFGDDLAADIQPATFYGIQTEQIFSASALASSRGWAQAIKTAETLMERCMIGMVIAELFRDPFRNPNLLELSPEDRLQRFAAGVVGPLAAAHMTWLLQKLQEKRYDGVLFLSRDGYLPIHIYRDLMERYPLPEAVYYYANRHSAFLCCCDDPSLITSAVNRGNFHALGADQLLINIYDLSKEDLLPPVEGETAYDYILRHMPEMRQRAQTARDANMVYAESCGIKPGGIYALVDFIAVGNTQQYLESFLPCRLEGFYFGNYSSSEREKLNIDNIEDYMAVENKSLIKNFIELESFFLSPEPPVDHIAEDGRIVFEEELRTAKELREYDLVFSVALERAKEFFRLFYQEGESIQPRLPEEMFAAEGYHGVQSSLYDDWPKVKMPVINWQDGK